MLQNARFQFEQIERWREDVLQRLEIFQLAGIHHPVRVHLAAIGREFGDALRLQVLELGEADAVLAGNHPAQRDDLVHHAVDDMVGALQHGPVVGENGDVDVHVAVAGVHVGGEHDAAVAHFLIGAVERGEHRRISTNQLGQSFTKLLQMRESTQSLRFERLQFFAEARAELQCGGSLGGDLLAVVLGLRSGEDLFGALRKAKLRVALLFNVDGIDKARELGERVQRDDDVLVHLEGVGAAGNGAELFAVRPEAT